MHLELSLILTRRFPNGLVVAGFVSVLSHICVYVGKGEYPREKVGAIGEVFGIQ